MKFNRPCQSRIRALLSAAAILLLLPCASAQDAPDAPDLSVRIAAAAPHPRLLMNDETANSLRNRIQNDETEKALFALLQENADAMLEQTTVIYHKEGKRLLSVSREVLKRVLYLAFVYRMTGDPKYATRALTEMETVAAFSDWNPSHFLDVAEMTTALAIGYDWLLPLFSSEQEALIRKAILEKGIAPSFDGHDTWVKRDNNWNQVCNAGMALGALALIEHEPALAEKTIARTLGGVPYAMKTYEPDGVYVEGPSYWEYGTTYNVLAIEALESALGSSFRLDESRGFQLSGAFPLLTTGPTRMSFNFADCGTGSAVSPAVYWFARRWKDTGILWFEEMALQKLLRKEEEGQSRFLPLLLIWRGEEPISEPRQPLHWKGDGTSPLSMHRSSWTDPDAIFLATKAGTPFSNHGHMDIGSFVLDADGCRWAMDFGAQGYGALEARGLDIWNRKQNADRWRVYRYHNASHNTLTVDGQGQKVTAASRISGFSAEADFPYTILDMSGIYSDQLARAQRGFLLLPDKRVLIQDEIAATDKAVKVRWAMCTPAEATDIVQSNALLTQGDKRLRFEVLSPEKTTVETFSTEPPNEWDAPNPGTRQIGFQISLEPGASAILAVLLTPGSIPEAPQLTLRPLKEWPNP